MANNADLVQYGRDIAVRLADYDAANALPANTVAWDGTWGGDWTAPGYTSGGLHVTTEVGRSPVEVDQELDPIALVATSRTTTMNTNLSQLDMDTVADATGQGTVTTQAATTAARGYKEYAVDAVVDSDGIAVGFDIKGRNGEPIRIFGPRGFPNAGMSLDFERDSATGVLTPLSVTLTPDPAQSNKILIIRTITPIAS